MYIVRALESEAPPAGRGDAEAAPEPSWTDLSSRPDRAADWLHPEPAGHGMTAPASGSPVASSDPATRPLSSPRRGSTTTAIRRWRRRSSMPRRRRRRRREAPDVQRGSAGPRTAPQAAYQRERAAASSQREMLRALELPTSVPCIAPRPCRSAWTRLPVVAVRRGQRRGPRRARRSRLQGRLGRPDQLDPAAGGGEPGCPVLLSTGMSTLDEVDEAMADLERHGDPPLICCTACPPIRPRRHP